MANEKTGVVGHYRHCNVNLLRKESVREEATTDVGAATRNSGLPSDAVRLTDFPKELK